MASAIPEGFRRCEIHDETFWERSNCGRCATERTSKGVSTIGALDELARLICAEYEQERKRKPTEAQQLAFTETTDKGVEYVRAVLEPWIARDWPELKMGEPRLDVNSNCVLVPIECVCRSLLFVVDDAIIAREEVRNAFAEAMKTEELLCKHAMRRQRQERREAIAAKAKSKAPVALTPEQCLVTFEQYQREDYGAMPLTPDERFAAQSAWSSTLRQRQAEARRVEREQVVCDEQWGEEL